MLPFLALGLGINDYFVLASYVSYAIAHAAPGGGRGAGGSLTVCPQCTRAHAPHPPPWPGYSFPDRLLTGHEVV